jgi:hypothetical protein
MKKSVNPLIKYFFLCCLLPAGCEQVHEMYTDPQITRKQIPLETYHTIWTYGIFDIRLVEDTVCKVMLNGKKSLLDNIWFNQRGKKILVGEEKKNQWYRGTDKPVLEFHFRKLRYLRIEEPSYLKTVDTIHTRQLKLILANELTRMDLMLDAEHVYMENWSTNTGVYHLTGRCAHLHVKLCGSGRLEAERLETQNAVIEQHSIANGYLTVTDTLEVYSKNEGNIFYSGDPAKIIFERHASGKLIRIK